jgi:hypothetical protein
MQSTLLVFVRARVSGRAEHAQKPEWFYSRVLQTVRSSWRQIHAGPGFDVAGLVPNVDDAFA